MGNKMNFFAKNRENGAELYLKIAIRQILVKADLS